MKKFLLIVLAVLVIGCGTTKEIVYEKVEVPKPYWEGPDNVKPTPEEPNYQVPHLTKDDAEADPTGALQIVGQDLALCLSDSELLRHLYEQLVILCTTPPENPPPDPPD